MNIIPISSYPHQSSSVPGVKEQGGAQNPFKSMFDNALAELEAANTQKQADTMALAMGEDVDLIALQTSALRAETSMQLLVQLRNKLLDAYQEIMRLNV